MYQPMFQLHWKQVRFALIPFVIAAFGLPLVSIQGMGSDVAARLNAYQVLEFSQLWLPLFPLLAVAVGATLGLSAWNWDHQLKHVYALSLPVSRMRYSTAKLLAGATLVLVPALAFWGGAHIAASAVSLPTGHADTLSPAGWCTSRSVSDELKVNGSPVFAPLTIHACDSRF